MATSSRSKPRNPDEAALRAHALAFPDATEDFPWEHRAIKVRGKVFVFMGTGAEGGSSDDDFFITCKLPESHAMALALAGVKPTGYGLGKAGWVSARYRPGKAPVAMLREWITESYRAVAPKTLLKALDKALDKTLEAAPRSPVTKRASPKKARAKSAASSRGKRSAAKAPKRGRRGSP